MRLVVSVPVPISPCAREGANWESVRPALALRQLLALHCDRLRLRPPPARRAVHARGMSSNSAEIWLIDSCIAFSSTKIDTLNLV